VEQLPVEVETGDRAVDVVLEDGGGELQAMRAAGEAGARLERGRAAETDVPVEVDRDPRRAEVAGQLAIELGQETLRLDEGPGGSARERHAAGEEGECQGQSRRSHAPESTGARRPSQASRSR